MNGQDELKITSKERKLDLLKVFFGAQKHKIRKRIDVFFGKTRLFYTPFSTFLA